MKEVQATNSTSASSHQLNALTLSTIKSEYTALIATVLESSKALAVIGQSTYTDAETALSSIQSAQKRVKAKLDEEIRPRYEELEQWYALKRELLSELDPAETRIKRRMADYNMEQQRLARERQKVRRTKENGNYQYKHKRK